jgi:hypothetical protein
MLKNPPRPSPLTEGHHYHSNTATALTGVTLLG